MRIETPILMYPGEYRTSGELAAAAIAEKAECEISTRTDVEAVPHTGGARGCPRPRPLPPHGSAENNQVPSPHSSAARKRQGYGPATFWWVG